MEWPSQPVDRMISLSPIIYIPFIIGTGMIFPLFDSFSDFLTIYVIGFSNEYIHDHLYSRCYMVDLRIGVPELELMKIRNELHLTSDCQARINYGVLGLIIVIVLPISKLNFFNCSVAPSTSSNIDL